jgi:hypothetical protein
MKNLRGMQNFCIPLKILTTLRFVSEITTSPVSDHIYQTLPLL